MAGGLALRSPSAVAGEIREPESREIFNYTFRRSFIGSKRGSARTVAV